ncbi:MAG TPA: protein-glutamate O-methyltransferase [Verrucomicrobiae bacterium]|jgi:chemotaxis protein methyltransferase CheR|nr:protein-glutamate O-methyltransferase [Verrucomicrobiae bacterium]
MSSKVTSDEGSADAGFVGDSLADADYDFLCRLVYERSRIHLGPDKRVLVTSRLAKRLRHHRLTDYGEYCDLLRSPGGGEELQFLIDRISTNHTHFFRELKHFDFLSGTVIPSWQAQSRRTGPFRIWSAASSTGEEAYSIAIHLAENFAPAGSGRWQIEGTDISTRVLEIAGRGIYEADKLGSIAPDMLRRHFQRGVNEWSGHLRVKEELRRRVNFLHLNLLDGNYPFARTFDLIFCRNVMIYFDRPTQETLVRQLAEKLVPGGHLLVGHSESLSGVKHGLKLVRPAIYVKPA